MKKSVLVLAAIVFVMIIVAIPVFAAETYGIIGGTYHMFAHYETAYIKDPIYDSSGRQSNKDCFFKLGAEIFNENGRSLASTVKSGTIRNNTKITLSCDKKSTSACGYHVGYISSYENGSIKMYDRGFDY